MENSLELIELFSINKGSLGLANTEPKKLIIWKTV